jgi:hypothetical protein
LCVCGIVERSRCGEGAPRNPPEPRPPGPEKMMPQEWGSDRKMRSARPSGKPTNRSGRPWHKARPLGMRGEGHDVEPKMREVALGEEWLLRRILDGMGKEKLLHALCKALGIISYPEVGSSSTGGC